MSLKEHFDAVVMLTWSDWKTEPRSNRYHYAKRFAKHMPVLFVQPWDSPENSLTVESTEVSGIDIVHASYDFTEQKIAEFHDLLYMRGIRNPLIWIYNSFHYQPLLDSMSRNFKIYHATEDYFTDSEGLAVDDTNDLKKSIKSLLPQMDCVVAVSQGVIESYKKHTEFSGQYLLLKNGCDAEFIFNNIDKNQFVENNPPIAIFQGGINKRLDYALLKYLAQSLPEWRFHFCGAVTDSDEWQNLLKEKNVKYLGLLKAEEIVSAMSGATAGLIPFIFDQWIANSLPLKAYEYVAAGLPVITVPIAALKNNPEIFAVAHTREEFVEKIKESVKLRKDKKIIYKRIEEAKKNSYDDRFDCLMNHLIEECEKLKGRPKSFRVGLLYDKFSTHVGTIAEHLGAFSKYSSHDYTYIPCTNPYGTPHISDSHQGVDLSVFDAIIVHYTVRLSLEFHLSEDFALAIEKYTGLKILFLQDEYEGTEIARTWMDRLKFNIVYTCVPSSYINYVYPTYRFPAAEFLPTLTGYVPEDPRLENFSLPWHLRKNDIGYRGRKLPAIYGALGYEKYRIGVEMKKIASHKNIVVDIEVDENRRIYGNAWYEFIGSCKATLGTESGANIFDFDGSIKSEIGDLIGQSANVEFEEIYSKILIHHEGKVKMNQVSPKIFEAIRLRTALILFEGEYSGVIEPDIHYIPLKKDFSNVDDVIRKINDDNFMKNIIDRAYQDVILTKKYSYESFVKGIDLDMAHRIMHPRHARILVGPIFYISSEGKIKQALPLLSGFYSNNLGLLDTPMSTKDLSNYFDNEISRSNLNSDLDNSVHKSLPNDSEINDFLMEISHKLDILIGGSESKYNNSKSSGMGSKILKSIWNLIPKFLRYRLVSYIGSILNSSRSSSLENSFVFRALRCIWHFIPSAFKRVFVRQLKKI